jgi:hypothetical protein
VGLGTEGSGNAVVVANADGGEGGEGGGFGGGSWTCTMDGSIFDSSEPVASVVSAVTVGAPVCSVSSFGSSGSFGALSMTFSSLGVAASQNVIPVMD